MLIWLLILSGALTIQDDVQHTKKAIMHFADNVGPDQHAYPCSLI